MDELTSLQIAQQQRNRREYAERYGQLQWLDAGGEIGRAHV